MYSLKSIPMYLYFITNDIPGISATILLHVDYDLLNSPDNWRIRQGDVTPQLELFSGQLSDVEKFIIKRGKTANTPSSHWYTVFWVSKGHDSRNSVFAIPAKMTLQQPPFLDLFQESSYKFLGYKITFNVTCSLMYGFTRHLTAPAVFCQF